jgi:hypothetical protein
MAVVERPRKGTLRLDGETIGRGEMRAVPVSVIKRDTKYQRDLQAAFIEGAGRFDPQLAGTIVLSSRAGGPYVLDGGHRVEIARLWDVHHINAFVIDGLTQADEAALFVKLNRTRRSLSSHALFKGELSAGAQHYPETSAMVRVVNNAGFTLAAKAGSNPTVITAIDSVRWVHRYGGDDLLARTLSIVKELWFGEPKATSGPTLKGVALFLASSGQQPMFRRDRLARVMEKFGPSKVERLAQAIAMKRNAAHVGPANFAEAVLAEYNKLVPKDEQPLPPLTISGKRRPGVRNAG